MTRSTTSFPRPPSDVESLALLSRGLVQLFRHRAGRGPTHAKAFWAGDDALLVLFGGNYTKAEKTLWLHGRPDTALAYRQAVLERSRTTCGVSSRPPWAGASMLLS